tara:strand:+ start:123 stop:281 length:159 start_codon:yes stop_codon:yes gene_type:complete
MRLRAAAKMEKYGDIVKLTKSIENQRLTIFPSNCTFVDQKPQEMAKTSYGAV